MGYSYYDDSSGGALAWGRDNYGQLGSVETTSDQYTPVEVSGNYIFSAIAGGYSHTCGIEDITGAAYCWGYGGNGRLGNGTTSKSTTPSLVLGEHTFSTISAGYRHTVGLSLNTTFTMPAWWRAIQEVLMGWMIM